MVLVNDLKSEYVDINNYWFAKLSNNLVVYEDKIPGLSTWHRLRSYLKNNSDVFVKKIGLHFFGRNIIMPPDNVDYDGLFFSKQNLSFIGIANFYLKGIGYVKNKVANVIWINTNTNQVTTEVINVKDNDVRVLNSDKKVSINKHSNSLS
jgi:hypothetical protein